MRRFALASVFGGFALSFFLTVVGAGLTGVVTREHWFSAHTRGFGRRGRNGEAFAIVLLVKPTPDSLRGEAN